MQLAYSSPIFCSLGVRLGSGFGRILENLLEVQAVQFVELGEAPVGSLVRRQRIALEPAVATVAIKVFAGVHRLVDQRWIEDAQLGRGRRGAVRVLAECGRCGENGDQGKAGGRE